MKNQKSYSSKSEHITEKPHFDKPEHDIPSFESHRGDTALLKVTKTGTQADTEISDTLLEADWQALKQKSHEMLQVVGGMQAAIEAHRKILATTYDAKIQRRLLISMHYEDNCSPQDIAAAHFAWGDKKRIARQPQFQPEQLKKGKKILTVGYLSPDFRSHPVAYFIHPLLASHDARHIRTVGYASLNRSDEVTRRIKSYCDLWREVHGMSTADLVQRIKDDRVDILVDLAGHTSGNRLDVFIQRAAPLQITYLGYPDGTGLHTMDYRITDSVSDLQGCAEALYREKLLRIDPIFLCIDLSGINLEVAAAPWLQNRIVTLGSFNNHKKYSIRTLVTWGRILQTLPNTRLVLKSRNLNTPASRQNLTAVLQKAGLSEVLARIELLNLIPSRTEHLRQYNRIDLALDPFPYNGTTTTCQALWMGVPVVTLIGAHHVARVGASILKQAGLEAFIARSSENYINIVRHWVERPQELADLRQNMRTQLLQSPLCDPIGFTRKLEAAYRRIWEKRCDEVLCYGNITTTSSNLPGMTDTGSKKNGISHEEKMPEGNHSSEPVRRLHIGGTKSRAGWEILNIQPADNVDHVGDARNLKNFADETFAEIYASHVLEHFNYTHDLKIVLREWWRVLIPGGRLCVSVPNLAVLSEMFLDQKLGFKERFLVMRMMFGGQTNPHDFHYVGFNYDILVWYFKRNGFKRIRQVRSFGLFGDNSNKVVNGRRISLNIEAFKAYRPSDCWFSQVTSNNYGDIQK